MANRRMIEKDISLNVKVSDLSDNAALLFTWAIAHTDDYGVIHADPRRVKAAVVPLREWSVDSVAGYLDEWIAAGLVQRYWCDGAPYIMFTGFDEHQTGLEKRRRFRALPHPNFSEGCSDTPEQDTTSANFSEVQKKSATREVKGTEENRTEGKAFARAVPACKSEDDDQPNQAAIRRVWIALGLTGPPTPPKDDKGKPQPPAYTTLTRLVDKHGIPRFERFADHVASEQVSLPGGAKPWPWFVETVREAMQAPWKWDTEDTGGNGKHKGEFIDSVMGYRTYEADWTPGDAMQVERLKAEGNWNPKTGRTLTPVKGFKCDGIE